MSEITEGTYFERKEMKVGTSGTSSSKVDDIHYYCKMKENGKVSLQMCKNDGRSTGYEVDEITLDDFKERFKDCSQHKCFLNMTEADAEQEKIDKITAQAQHHLNKKEYLSAEFEFKNALKLDEDNVKANYGLGKTYLEKGDEDKAKEVFEQLSHIDALFENENKHIFNEMGIDLRKMGLFDEAIHNYEKAIEIDPKDHALLYNIGRAYKEKGDLPKSKKYLEQAMSISPDFEEGKKYLAGLERLMKSA